MFEAAAAAPPSPPRTPGRLAAMFFGAFLDMSPDSVYRPTADAHFADPEVEFVGAALRPVGWWSVGKATSGNDGPATTAGELAVPLSFAPAVAASTALPLADTPAAASPAVTAGMTPPSADAPAATSPAATAVTALPFAAPTSAPPAVTAGRASPPAFVPVDTSSAAAAVPRPSAVHVGRIDPRLRVNVASFEHVMREAGEIIMDMSGVFVKAPNMMNGRCFVSSKALSEAPLEQVKSHLLVRRNETGVPILKCGTIDGPRHDWELKMAREAAETIIAKLEERSVGERQCYECCVRLRLGHVLEESDVELISRIMNFRLQVACSDDKEKPFYEVNGGDGGDPESNLSKKTYRFVLRATNLEETHHWEALILVPSVQLLGVCRAVLQLKFQVPHTADREVYKLKSEVSTLKRKLKKSRNICLNVLARMKDLEHQQTKINTRCQFLEDRFKGDIEGNTAPRFVAALRPPPSAFALFRSSIKGELVGNAAASQRWKDLSEEEKTPFIKEFERRRVAYHESKRLRGAA